jgi:hypothetical protein
MIEGSWWLTGGWWWRHVHNYSEFLYFSENSKILLNHMCVGWGVYGMGGVWGGGGGDLLTVKLETRGSVFLCRQWVYGTGCYWGGTGMHHGVQDWSLHKPSWVMMMSPVSYFKLPPPPAFHTRSINEDRVQLAGEPDDITIHPEGITFSERRDG